jgi:threonine aldolase
VTPPPPAQGRVPASPPARSFASDNWAGVHPDVLAEIVAANDGHAPSYGVDPLTEKADRLFRRHFGEDAEVYFTFNGTGANVVGLQSLLRPFEAVICASSAHINNDECGAPEHAVGCKLLGVETPDGKLTPELAETAMTGVGDEHHVQPKVLSITQATELGTCYSVEEVAALAEWAHARDLSLHVDGARLANAAAHFDVALGAFGSAAGVDVLSFGGTKNGAMGAEAVVVFRPATDTHLPFIRKQSMQLASKMRFVAAQFVALLSDDLWKRNARHANEMALRLAAQVADIHGVEVTQAVDSNAVFASLPGAVARELQREFPFHVWDESTGVVRWMCAFDTTEEDVDRFAEALRKAMDGAGR